MTDGPGSCRRLFAFPGADFVAADLYGRAGVDVVLEDPHRLPFADGAFDVVLGGALLGRCESFARHFVELRRVLHPRGLLFLLVPLAALGERTAAGDAALCPEALDDLARMAVLFLVERRIDRRGPVRHLVGVFAGRPDAARISAASASGPRGRVAMPRPTLAPGDPTPPRAIDLWRRYAADVRAELVNGRAPLSARIRGIARRCPRLWIAAGPASGPPGRVRYTVLLERLHAELEPRLYVEVGVRHGRSLRLSKGRAIGVDPASTVSDPLPARCTIIDATSDDFFAEQATVLVDSPVDLAFVDGLHLFEYALRDFMHLERLASPSGIIVVDDVFPNEPAQAERVCRTGIWMGDVWKIAYILREHRPDLVCLPVDVGTGGLLLVAGLDPGNDVLWDRYDEVVERFSLPSFDTVPPEVLARTGALHPDDDRIRLLVARLRELRDGDADPSRVRAAIAAIVSRTSHPPASG